MKGHVQATLEVFYRVERAGAIRLPDGGGPFGFDVTKALLVDDLLAAYECDAILETGCFLGDTTRYLAARYPNLPVYSCDIVAKHVEFTRRRLAAAGCRNVLVSCVDSPGLVEKITRLHERPLIYLDAHWEIRWPLDAELAAVARGVVLVDDFDIGHHRFSFDTYAGRACNAAVFAVMPSPPTRYWIPDPNAPWPLPCLQVGRRSGTGLTVIGLDADPLDRHPALTGHDLVLEAPA
ncbi:hypothetical protein DQ384_02665 [Sphaerisporangium album]|uniref:Class I SAM-dependent methyltransferase n=1 Tax=Sphaerisporangium album TaxID=509200 RepID=A0A367FUR0_9ACTN|nr:class I SAM-dependent methyltransferase [Sphaerisporangium album]RCG33335.1 hypothetical protein DQ384_02665 [Sphaerisporangium album]